MDRPGSRSVHQGLISSGMARDCSTRVEEVSYRQQQKTEANVGISVDIFFGPVPSVSFRVYDVTSDVT